MSAVAPALLSSSHRWTRWLDPEEVGSVHRRGRVSSRGDGAVSDFMPQIEHFVYLMLENRSFDNLMGWLYDDRSDVTYIDGPSTSGTSFMGLQGERHTNRFDDDPIEHGVQRGTASMDTPDPDPHEPYLHVNKQLFGVDLPPCGQRNHSHALGPGKSPVPHMEGFLADYATARKGKLAAYTDDCGMLGSIARALTKSISRQEALAILNTFAPEQVPVITDLAKAYAVSDYWFSSVPTQTNVNRAFSVCGTSLGQTDNHGPLKGFIPDPFPTPSIWDTLSEHGKGSTSDWMVYYQAKLFWTSVYSERAFRIPDPDRHVAPIDDFFAAVDAKSLPTFSYLEPAWLGAHIGNNGNSYHPPAQVVPGEKFLKRLYESLTANSDVWDKTLLMVTFDEHGGTYDHIPPLWDAEPPWGKGNPPPKDIKLEHGFGFDRFGVRVPTILASPWIDERVVFRSTTHVPYDHTSMAATVLTWMGIPSHEWGLGARVTAAPTFEGVLTRSSPRRDAPSVG